MNFPTAKSLCLFAVIFVGIAIASDASAQPRWFGRCWNRPAVWRTHCPPQCAPACPPAYCAPLLCTDPPTPDPGTPEELWPITPMGTDGYFYYYETSCCLSPEHIGVLTTFLPIQTCECGVSCGNMSAPEPTYVFAGEPTHPSPLAPSKTPYDDTLIFSRLSSRGLNNLSADPNANPPSLLQPLKGPKGKYLIKIKDDRLKDKWYLLFTAKSDTTEHTYYFARLYRGKEDDDLFGKDYDRIQNDAKHEKLKRSKKNNPSGAPEEPGPLFKVVLEISEIPGPNGKPFKKDFHVALLEGFGP